MYYIYTINDSINDSINKKERRGHRAGFAEDHWFP